LLTAIALDSVLAPDPAHALADALAASRLVGLADFPLALAAIVALLDFFRAAASTVPIPPIATQTNNTATRHRLVREWAGKRQTLGDRISAHHSRGRWPRRKTPSAR
jgi:hypothetical protein